MITGDRDNTSSVGGHDTTQLSAVAKPTLSSQPKVLSITRYIINKLSTSTI